MIQCCGRISSGLRRTRMPPLKLPWADRSTEVVKLPVDMWNLGHHFDHRVPGGKTVTAAELDPRRALPDVKGSNNRRSR